MPDVLEAALLGQLDATVLAVVEEALLAADVADLRLGHRQPLQPLRHLAGVPVGGQDPGLTHQVPHGDDADEHPVRHHREVPVPAL